MIVFKMGDPIWVSWKGRRELGQVIYASSNGESLLVEVEAMIGGFAGRVPLLWDEGTFITLIDQIPVSVEKR